MKAFKIIFHPSHSYRERQDIIPWDNDAHFDIPKSKLNKIALAQCPAAGQLTLSELQSEYFLFLIVPHRVWKLCFEPTKVLLVWLGPLVSSPCHRKTLYSNSGSLHPGVQTASGGLLGNLVECDQ